MKRLLAPFLIWIGLSTSACSYLRIDTQHYLIRSDIIQNEEQEQEIVSRASLTRTENGQIRVIVLRGTPYERGYQYGKLLREEVQDNLGLLYKRAIGVFRSEELFAEVYERMRPYIAQEYIDEMQGLAHGSRLPLHVIHHIHVLADMGEWGGKKRLKQVLERMMDGSLRTMCSNICGSQDATADKKMYTVRILDWGLHRISKLHRYPIVAINIPDKGIPYANIGWVGYLGAISGMNSQGITLGEMGYRDPENETLRGEPMPFVLRDVLSKASSLADVRRILKDSVGTNSYVFLMSDGKTGEYEMYMKDRDRFRVERAGKEIVDTTAGKTDVLPAISNVLYGGRFNDKLNTELNKYHGKLTPEILMEKIIPEVAMKSNFQNVIYLPAELKFWVNNAKSKSEWAASQPYTFVDLKKMFDDAGCDAQCRKGK